jgi:hypothetical protein
MIDFANAIQLLGTHIEKRRPNERMALLQSINQMLSCNVRLLRGLGNQSVPRRLLHSTDIWSCFPVPTLQILQAGNSKSSGANPSGDRLLGELSDLACYLYLHRSGPPQVN